MSQTDKPTRASLEGFASKILELVSRGATRKQWAEWLRVPLEHAAADGNIDLFNALIGAGADVSAGWRGCEGRTLFHAAAVGGSAEVVSGLVAAGGAQPDVNVVPASHRRSALYLATSLGHEEAARRLVVAGADVHYFDPDDRCEVLFTAAQRGCTQLVNDLLMGGANPNTHHGMLGTVPLHVAAACGFEEVVETLLARGADKDATDQNGRSPLIIAAGSGHLAVVNILLAAGVDAEIFDLEPAAALDNAAERGHIEILKAIVRHGVNVNAVDENGWAALHCAAAGNQAGAIDALIEVGANLELRDSDGWTPLCSATYSRCFPAMRALIHHGARSDVRDYKGNTLLHLTCRRRGAGLDATLDLLLRLGADETAVNNIGNTPDQALLTCSPGETDRARLLLARAPVDRAWRRRCWLVMLRCRASKTGAARCETGSGSRGDLSAAVCREGSEGSERVRNEQGRVGEECEVFGQAGNEGVVGTGGEEAGLSSLGTLMASLIGLELEGVFRTVVSFL